MINLYALVNRELEFYNMLISQCEANLNSQSYYKGMSLQLHVHNNKEYYTLRFSDSNNPKDKNLRYIGAANDDVRNIKTRRYVEMYLARLKEHRNLLQTIKSKIKPMDPAAIEAALPKAYRDHSRNSIKHQAFDEITWLKAQEELKRANPLTLRNPMQKVDRNLYVRSKSELIGHERLEYYNITHIFECPVEISPGKYRYPDFLIFINGKVYIWEHLGMMYDKKYLNGFFEKLNDYARIGYTPGVNLFFTFDDINGNLDPLSVDNIIMSMINNAYCA